MKWLYVPFYIPSVSVIIAPVHTHPLIVLKVSRILSICLDSFKLMLGKQSVGIQTLHLVWLVCSIVLKLGSNLFSSFILLGLPVFSQIFSFLTKSTIFVELLFLYVCFFEYSSIVTVQSGIILKSYFWNTFLLLKLFMFIKPLASRCVLYVADLYT